MTDKNDTQTQEDTMNVMAGIPSKHDGIHKTSRRRFKKRVREIPVEQMTNRLLEGSRLDLARAITLIESIKNSDKKAGQQLLLRALPHSGNSIRIGVTGVPGAGKSTFIEQLGLMLCEQNYKVAVLAIDPSSSLTGGSILGDKTRMEKLAAHPNAFIRPSPTSGTLGGVHRKTRETMLLCEAAGYDILLIETVGVGQSETAVRNMVDFFMLLVLTGAGDDLQGMKKGIMELTDMIVVHKADGKNIRPAKRTVREYKQILHYLQPATPGWTSKPIPVSSYDKTGFTEVWDNILTFREQMIKRKYWDTRRHEQTKDWFHAMIENRLIDAFFAEKGRKEQVTALENQLLKGQLTVADAVDTLFE